VPLEGRFTVCDDGVIDRLKVEFGTFTTRLAVVECDNEPLVPVTVTE
jgi:hypothetical protein